MSLKIFEPEQSPFKIIYVDVTHRCQMSCANCYLPNRTIADMNIPSLIDCLKRLPTKTDLRLVGGEPTLRKDLDQIISQITALGHRPILITNGLKLADLEYTQTLKAAGLKYAQISLNGLSHDSIYQVIDQMACAKEKIMAVENCVKVGISPSLSCILVRNLNTHLVEEFIDFAETLPKPVRINFRNVGAIGRNMTSQIKSLSMKEIADLLAAKLNISANEILSHKVADNQIRLLSKKGTRYSQQVIVKITDWSLFQNKEIIDPKALVRGRITQDFKVAPHFEHVKANEFGY